MYPLLFADRARKVMQLASREAFRLNHEYIGTEHILLGLIKEGSGVTPSMLSKVDRDLRKVRLEVEKFVQTGSSMITLGKLPYTLDAKKVMEYADEEARNSRHPCVEAEHILLGLLREPEGIAGQVLMSFGLNAEELRAEIEAILRQPYRIAEATPLMQGSNRAKTRDTSDQ